MRFLRKSIIRKLFVNLFLFLIILFLIFFYFYWTGEELISFYFLFIILGVFLVYFLLVYYVDIIRPIKKILKEMQALLSGENYKRIYTKRIDELGIIAHFFNEVTKSIGEVSYDIKDRDRLLTELSIASELQQNILPSKNPKINGLQVVAKVKMASELGGDSFNFFKKDNKHYIYIGDVTGHGFGAGLVMTMANSLINVFTDIYDSPYDILVNVNKHIKKHIKKSMFMTLVMLCWDDVKNKMTYVGAGHEYILVYRSNSGKCEAVLSGGTALGMVPDNSKIIKEAEIELQEGDFIILYSDGITEAKNVAGEQFGLDRLKELITEYAPEHSSEGLHYKIAKKVSDFMKGTSQEDDMTLIVLKRKGKTESEEIKDNTIEWEEK